MNEIEIVKKLTIIGLFADDAFLERFVLHGGNALRFVYDITSRPSMDIDVAMEDDFPAEELTRIEQALEASLARIFKENGFVLFDFKFAKRPKADSQNRLFWGGYFVKFKVLRKDFYNQYANDTERLSRSGQKMEVDISKFEFTQPKQPFELDDYTLYVYSLPMMIFEKLRALCQQRPVYRQTISQKEDERSRKARPRDAYDIYRLIQHIGGESVLFAEPINHEILTGIFNAKRVNLALLNELEEDRELHRQDETALKESLLVGEEYLGFDFYYDFTVGLALRLYEAFGNE